MGPTDGRVLTAAHGRAHDRHVGEMATPTTSCRAPVGGPRYPRTAMDDMLGPTATGAGAEPLGVPARPVGSPVRRAVWIAVGLLCVGLGCLGLVLPGMPATVFFIAAAAAFSKSSPRLEQWVLGLRGVGPLVRDYRAGLGMPRRAKVMAIATMTVAITVSVVLIDALPVRLAVVALGLVGAVVIVRVRERAPDTAAGAR